MQKQTPPDPVGVLVDFLVMITAAVVALGWIRGWFGGGGLLADLRSKARRKSKPREPFTSLAEVERSIRQEGLESCSLILAVDFTRSNEFTGEVSFGGHSLHDTSRPDTPNPYQRVISIIGRTLAHFDDDGIIPAFGFGDIQTRASRCFPFFPDRDCLGLDEVLERYSEIAAGVQMSGPTNFAPAIREAVRRVRETDNAFHVLIIVADGQVDRVDETAAAIVAAAEVPLAIVCVGVGDGPWDLMHEFDDGLPARRFDNFQFVDFGLVEAEAAAAGLPLEPQFALAALMELSAQFKFLRGARML